MEPTRYFIKGRTVLAADPALQDSLARVYGSPERPRCMCVSGGVEMYIARHAEYVVKRMPDTGHQHHPTCPSFEPEPGTSGLGELVGEAIIEHSPDQVEVRTDFAMSRMPGRAVPRGEAVPDPAEVHAPRKRMSLRALLHFLYERAGFNRWYPAMEGRRNQGVLHKYLSEAARGVMLKGASLDERLYVPEPFRAELKDEIGERRRSEAGRAALTGRCRPVQDGHHRRRVQRLGADEPRPQDRRQAHAGRAAVHRDRGPGNASSAAMPPILQARDADVPRKPRVMMAALVYAKREHVYQVDTVSMMLTTDQWIPLDGLHELPLIEALQREQRAFLKPLKYDARSGAAFPNVLLLDSGKAPVPLHVVSPFAQAKERSIKEKVLAADPSAWVWSTDQVMPPLPGRTSGRAHGGGWPASARAVRYGSADSERGKSVEEEAGVRLHEHPGANLTG